MQNIRVGTFNVFNLVTPGVDFYREGSAYGEEEFEEKISWIGRHLDEMEVDLVGFQEVFHKSALQKALAKSKHFAGVQPIVLSTEEDQNPARTPAVGLATILEIVGEPQSITEFPEDAIITVEPGTEVAEAEALERITVPVKTFSRPVLKVRVRFRDDMTVTILVAHLKSKRPTLLMDESSDVPIHRSLGAARSLIRRAAEAAALRSLIVSEAQGDLDPVIVLGDFNDGTLAITTQMIAGEQPFFNLSKEKKAPYRDVLLYTAQQTQAQQSTRDTYFTHIFNGSYEALDHIMVSQEFCERNPARLGEVDYVRVFNDHIIDEMASFDEIPRTRSDHGQVVVKLRLQSREP